MKIISGLDSLGAEDRGASAVIGNFDGVHRGHRAVLDLARRDAPLSVVTFEPHPREVFAPDAPPFRLMTLQARADRLAELGVEKLFVIEFNKDFSSLTAEEFCADVITTVRPRNHIWWTPWTAVRVVATVRPRAHPRMIPRTTDSVAICGSQAYRFPDCERHQDQ